ncbi:hypothetical protein HHK36_030696 [Tetracentron sinense]|uniref:Peptidase C14 caspase domain-containing protein n=1 Tax=Tetracentron sinense TaxID=13715 RepID=A0A835D0W6_TETSI|nr:hypothetical protein HHK36_030696 [Tetracentron sinense]
MATACRSDDESICPLNYETEAVILDDEINETIVPPLPKGVKLHIIIDACHSGTSLDLPFVCKINRMGEFEWESHQPNSGAYKGTSCGLAISFSACEDDQTSTTLTYLHPTQKMADSKEKCLSCGEQQRVSLEDRCNACQTVTQAPTNEVFGRTQGQVPRLEIRNLIRGFLRRKINQLTSSVNNYTASMLPCRSQGRKRALLCGVSYKGNIWELHGTINDVHCMRYFLVEKLGFPDDSILILTEEELDPTKIPTKRNIQKALKWLVEGCKSGDSLVFHYSGHGIQKRNLTGDELDGYDESLCPLDYETEGVILDDEINETIVQPLPQGVQLHAIIDASHSGTTLDLPFVYKINRRGKSGWESHEPKSGANKGTSGGIAISFSACGDNQSSYATDMINAQIVGGHHQKLAGYGCT